MSTITAIKHHDDDKQSSEMLTEYLEPLRVFLNDETLTEICVNRPREVWTEGREGWKQHAVPSLNFQHCRQLATLVASYNGKSITTDKPVLSAALPKGERVQVIIPPACEPNTVSITIRKPSMIDKTLDELDAEGAFEEFMDVDDELLPFQHELLKLKAERHICTAFDIVHILKKGRHAVSGCEVSLNAERAEADPKVFTRIHFHYSVKGRQLKPEAVARAIELSKNKYCSASIMLGKTARMTSDFEILEES